MNKKEKVRVAIIDSGIKSELKEYVKECYTVIDDNNKVRIVKDCDDINGHGTGIASLFLRDRNILDLYIIKIVDDMESTLEKMIAALTFIDENIECDLIHISSGIVNITDYNLLESVISRLTRKKITIVSAFDNYGAISYPAALKQVIGVSSENLIRDKQFYYITKNEIVDVITSNKYYRVDWVNPERNIVCGSSFTSVDISKQICHLIKKYGRLSKIDMLNLLNENHEYINDGELITREDEKGLRFIKQIKKAVVFPVNKEIKQLLTFSECLNFKIKGVYDIPSSINIGKSLSDLIKIKKLKNDHIIKNIFSIDWNDDFDTIIIGHCSRLSQLLGYDILGDLITKAKINNKKVYCFDETKYIDNIDVCSSYNLNFSQITSYEKFGKLYMSSKPILGIFGTNSEQGKFTLLMLLKQAFIKKGYKIGTLGTEPTSLLLNNDYMYHFGYDSNLSLNDYKIVSLLNTYINKIEQKNIDLTILSCQSGSLTYNYFNTSNYNIPQYSFLLGTNPDTFILVVNFYDEIEYLKRTISFLESVSGGKVLFLYLYSLTIESTTMGLAKRYRELTKEEIKEYQNKIKEQINLDVYTIKDIDIMTSQIENYYAEE